MRKKCGDRFRLVRILLLSTILNFKTFCLQLLTGNAWIRCVLVLFILLQREGTNRNNAVEILLYRSQIGAYFYGAYK